ncbi:MAG: PLP-dependent transferase, partial [Pirellulaceae bacterium]
QAAADRFIEAAARFPFCPSLGELSTTLSHPASTSHRKLSEPDRARVGITGGTIRLSVGVESTEYILESLAQCFSTMESS